MRCGMSKNTLINVNYRAANKSDVIAMARLRAEEWGTERYWCDRMNGYLGGVSNPRASLEPRIIYVAEKGNTLVGFIAGHLTGRFQCQGELQWINVEPEHRGTGVASELLRMLASWFVEQEAMRICVDVEPDNTTAQQFYRRHGAKNLNEHWLVWDDISTVLANPR